MKDTINMARKDNILFLATSALLWFALYAYIPQLSFYAKELGANAKMIGLITGIYGLVQSLLRIPFGLFSDKINNRKIFIVIGFYAAVFSAMLVFLFPNPFTLVLARAFVGISAATWVMHIVLFSSYFEPSFLSKSVGIMNSVNAAGQFFAMLTGMVLLVFLPIKYLFLLSFLAAFLGLICSYSIKDIKKDEKSLTLKELMQVAKNKKVIHASILAILDQFITHAAVFAYMPLLAIQFGGDAITLSYFTLVGMVPMMLLASFFTGAFLDKIGVRFTLSSGFFIIMLSCFSLIFIHNLYLLFIVQLILGIGRCMTLPILMGESIKYVTPEKKSSAMGLFQAIYGIGIFSGPVILGIIIDSFGFSVSFLLLALIALTAIIYTHITATNNA